MNRWKRVRVKRKRMIIKWSEWLSWVVIEIVSWIRGDCERNVGYNGKFGWVNEKWLLF